MTGMLACTLASSPYAEHFPRETKMLSKAPVTTILPVIDMNRRA
jgi:hypothetical protein